jgi:hypothetical protein
MTARVAYASSIGLFAILGCGAFAAVWFTDYVGETGMHGPIGLVAAIPFLLVFAVGGLILAVLVFRARLGVMPTVVGLLPLGALALALFGMALLSLAA